ncbi:hypothetical protein DVR12_17640 [Chitinophaga silvatica]|uniref:Uncharacterized protein n=1 Tax=Chitinophaga silvatica TaxID=2282649 RepID=A0A3E1Y8G0_9BACT|nr:hypothetical protein [Chitinophaga silvatica]RFS21158.1 hypothetical protein DVR12_17640 [Chitinophaga silvatica]
MRLLLGWITIFLIAVLSIFISFNDYRYENGINMNMLLWSIVLLALGIWSLVKPKLAFILILIFYLVTAIYRYITQGGEILVFLLIHITFIVVMLLSIWVVFTKEK